MDMETRSAAGFFDAIHFTESTLGRPVVDGTVLKIPVRGVSFVAPHPLAGISDRSGLLVFEGVAESRRTVSTYIGDPRNPSGFQTDTVHVDGPFTSQRDATLCDFRFEGLIDDPPAWVKEWIVQAQGFRFELAG